MKKTNNALIKNIVALGFLQIANYLLPLITLPYLSRVLGSEYFGLLGVSNAMIIWLVIITDFGFQLSVTPEISRERENHTKIGKIYTDVVYAKMILVLLSFILLIVYTMLMYKNHLVFFLLSFGVVLSQTFFPVWFFQGIEKMGYITAISVFIKVFFTILVFPFVRKNTDIVIVPLLNSIGTFIGTIIANRIVFRTFDIHLGSIDLESIMDQLKKSATFFLSRLSVSLYTGSTALILSFIAPLGFIGNYAAAEKIYTAIQMMNTPVITSIYPHFARTPNPKKFIKILIFSLIIYTPILVAIYFLAPTIISFLFGNDYYQSIGLLRVFCVTSLIVMPSQLMGYPLFGMYRKESLVNRTVLIGAFIHLVMISMMLLDLISYSKIVVMILFTEIIVFSLRLFYYKRLIQSF